MVTDLDNAFVTLGADVGGGDADAATVNHLMELRVLLAQECVGPYGQSLSEIALVLRIDGSVQSWRKSGVDNVRVQKKSRYATADIFMPADVWRTGGTMGIREFMVSGTMAAVEKILERTKREKLDTDHKLLNQDLQRVALKYLNASNALRH